MGGESVLHQFTVKQSCVSPHRCAPHSQNTYIMKKTARTTKITTETSNMITTFANKLTKGQKIKMGHHGPFVYAVGIQQEPFLKGNYPFL